MKKKQFAQSIKLMDLSALKKSIVTLGREAVKMKLEKEGRKGGKDVHGYSKKRKEIARTKTAAKLKEIERGQNGQA